MNEFLMCILQQKKFLSLKEHPRQLLKIWISFILIKGDNESKHSFIFHEFNLTSQSFWHKLWVINLFYPYYLHITIVGKTTKLWEVNCKEKSYLWIRYSIMYSSTIRCTQYQRTYCMISKVQFHFLFSGIFDLFWIEVI